MGGGGVIRGGREVGRGRNPSGRPPAGRFRRDPSRNDRDCLGARAPG